MSICTCLQTISQHTIQNQNNELNKKYKYCISPFLIHVNLGLSFFSFTLRKGNNAVQSYKIHVFTKSADRSINYFQWCELYQTSNSRLININLELQLCQDTVVCFNVWKDSSPFTTCKYTGRSAGNPFLVPGTTQSLA